MAVKILPHSSREGNEWQHVVFVSLLQRIIEQRITHGQGEIHESLRLIAVPRPAEHVRLIGSQQRQGTQLGAFCILLGIFGFLPGLLTISREWKLENSNQ